MAQPASGASTTTTSTTPANVAPQLTVNDPTENQDISTRNGDHTISGSVSAPGASVSDIDRMEVWINGEPKAGAKLSNKTPVSAGLSSAASTPTHLASAHITPYVSTPSNTTGKNIATVRAFNTTEK